MLVIAAIKAYEEITILFCQSSPIIAYKCILIRGKNLLRHFTLMQSYSVGLVKKGLT